MSSQVQISRRRGFAHAECEGCDNLSPDATRERCRHHAARTGHVVRYLIEDTTIYRRAEEATDER